MGTRSRGFQQKRNEMLKARVGLEGSVGAEVGDGVGGGGCIQWLSLKTRLGRLGWFINPLP